MHLIHSLLFFMSKAKLAVTRPFFDVPGEQEEELLAIISSNAKTHPHSFQLSFSSRLISHLLWLFNWFN
jgi:hypothetical protein